MSKERNYELERLNLLRPRIILLRKDLLSEPEVYSHHDDDLSYTLTAVNRRIKKLREVE